MEKMPVRCGLQFGKAGVQFIIMGLPHGIPQKIEEFVDSNITDMKTPIVHAYDTTLVAAYTFRL